MGRLAKRGKIDLTDDPRPTEQVVQVNEQLSVTINTPIVCDRKGFEKKVKAGLRHAVEARKRGLMPTPYFFEALDYVRKAKILQDASLQSGGLGTPKVPKVGDPLMENIPIYNTVQRRYAGFSNVLEQLWYAKKAPKFAANAKRDFVWSNNPWKSAKMEYEWLFICLVHRLTGSGASFEWDHGFRNNRVSEMARMLETRSVNDAAKWLAEYDGPIFTSIGNQIPPFPKTGGRHYIQHIAPELVERVLGWIKFYANKQGGLPIKNVVDRVLEFNQELGCRRFVFVLTAWVMDIAEYMPHLVNPNSDVYHGKNAQEAIEICFEVNMKKQDLYDKATRLFADIYGTHPMDVEDASPGCDLVRWIENYVPKKGFDHVIEKGIFNGSSLVWDAGRQPDPF